MFELKKYRNMEYRPVMIELFKLFLPNIYVEIGILRGYTFNALAPLAKKAIGVDINILPSVNLAPNVHLFSMTSETFAAAWTDPIDILFIDADHRHDEVLADFDRLSPFVVDNGLIFLHDTHPVTRGLLREGFCSNAWKAAQEIHKSEKYADWEIVTLPGPWAGLSIIRKATKHLMWRR